MPRYVVEMDVPAVAKLLGSRRYFLYSTVVDAPVTEFMTEDEMHAWLVEHDYGWWLECQLVAPKLTWNGKFLFASQKECYYTLPIENWRDE